MKKLLFILLIVVNAYSNELFTLPDESNFLKEKIRYEILSSKESIFIAMYNFSYKNIAKDLIKASKNGVNVTVVLDKSKVEANDKIYNLLKEANIKVIIPNDSRKMHLKTMIFDDKLALIGSLNFTKKSFENNHDLVYFTKDRKIIQKLKDIRAKFE